MYKVKDIFTTRDGRLDNTGEQFAIPQEMRERYGAELGDKGCATCIFVKLIGGTATHVRFYTNGGHSEVHAVDSARWAKTTMFNPGSGYNPDNILGPWSVHADGTVSEVVEGIGLPYGWHVSTFVVLEWEEGAQIPPEDTDVDTGPQIPEPGPDDQDRLWVTMVVNGVPYSGWLQRSQVGD